MHLMSGYWHFGSILEIYLGKGDLIRVAVVYLRGGEVGEGWSVRGVTL